MKEAHRVCRKDAGVYEGRIGAEVKISQGSELPVKIRYDRVMAATRDRAITIGQVGIVIIIGRSGTIVACRNCSAVKGALANHCGGAGTVIEAGRRNKSAADRAISHEKARLRVVRAETNECAV